MNPAIADRVVYIDIQGVEHNALVFAVNGLHEGYASLVYVKPDGSVATLYDVVHVDDASKQENNPDLPSVHLNVWKFAGEEHKSPAKDHPIFDHPFHRPTDDHGNLAQISRPEHEAEVAAHQESVAEKIEHAVGDALGEAVAEAQS